MTRRAPVSLALVLALAACGDRAAPLHERQSFGGEVELQVEGEAPLRGRLTFDRQSGNLQLTLGEREATVTLRRDASGEVRAFQETEWREPSADEARWFSLAEKVVQARAEDAAGAGDDYIVTTGSRRIRVRILGEAAGHGHR